MIASLDKVILKNKNNLSSWLMDITFQERISQQAKSSFISKLFDFQHSIINQFTETQTLLHKDLVPFLDIYQPLTIINKYEFLVTSGVAEKLFTLNPMVVLWGNAGNGKTTIVKYLFIDSTLTSYKIPILLNLRDIIIPIKKQDKNQPENIIYDHILNHLNFSVDSVDAIIIKEMLKYGKFLILLDGYDETDYDKSNILNTEIHDFSLRYNDCAYFMTSRFDSKATSLLSFKPYQIMPFDKSEIKSFIRRQFLNKTARIDEIIATVFKAENSRYLEYLENPLFLLLFLNSFDIYPNIPPKKSRFFENVYNALYEKHDSFAKLGFNRKRYIELPKDIFEKVLFSFCFLSYFDKKYSFDQTLIDAILDRIKKQYSYNFVNVDYTQELKISLNLLVQEDYTLKFIHLSLQEFFAAKFLMYLKENEKEYVYEILAQMENKYGGNQFMLETIAELYPNDFYDYFIPAHIRYCCISYEQLFIKGMYDNELYKNSIERYPYARRLIEKSENAYQIYLKFLEDYPKDTTLTSFALEFKDTPNENYAVEIQTLYRNHNILLQMLKDYSDSQTNATKKILDIVFDKSAKNTYKPFGGIRLPNSKD